MAAWRPLLLAASLVSLLAVPAMAAPPYPEKTSDPRVQGPEPRQDGQVVTANPGSWTPAPQSSMTFSYQWFRCAQAGMPCEPIPGATTQSYTLAPGEVGRRVKVQVTGDCTLPSPVCQPMTGESALTGTVLPDPNNEAPPEVTGLAVEGQLLAGSVGFWRSVADLGFGYQWLRCDQTGLACVNIGAATASQYRLGAADVGRTIRVSVTASNARPHQATAVSAPTQAVQRRVLRPRGRRGLRLLSPFPKIVLAGVVTESGADLSEFSIRGPRGAIAAIHCRGRGCPFRSRRFRLRARRVRVHALERRLRAGLVLEITVTRPGFVGKFSRFRIRAGRVPKRTDLCLRPGARRPTRCPRGV